MRPQISHCILCTRILPYFLYKHQQKASFQERKKSEGNLLFSPFSIQTALSMVTLGSKGSSLDQLMSFVSDTTTVKDQLALANKVVQMKQMFGQALPNFHTNNNFSIELANSIFVQEEYPILDGMMSDLSKYFESKVSFTDYKQPEKAADLINSWIEENLQKLGVTAPFSVSEADLS